MVKRYTTAVMANYLSATKVEESSNVTSGSGLDYKDSII